MLNFSSFFMKGLNGTLRLLNNTNFSYKGQWIPVYSDTVLDKWYIGDFMSADYTISIDFDGQDKEIIKCLVVAGIDTASLSVYGRTNLGNNIVDVSATVNNSFVEVVLNLDSLGTRDFTGARAVFSVNYYCTVSPLIA